jgi:hypothetical protein
VNRPIVHCCLVAVLAATVPCAPDPVRAGDADISLAATAALPAEQDMFRSTYQTGYGLAVSIAGGLVPHLELGGTVALTRFAISPSGLKEALPISPEAQIDFSGGALNTLEMLGDVRWYPLSSAAWRPYLLGTTGITFRKVDNLDVMVYDQGELFPLSYPEKSEIDVTLGGGLGLEARLSDRLRLFGDGRYLVVFDDPANMTYAPLRVGLKLVR